MLVPVAALEHDLSVDDVEEMLKQIQELDPIEKFDRATSADDPGPVDDTVMIKLGWARVSLQVGPAALWPPSSRRCRNPR